MITALSLKLGYFQFVDFIVGYKDFNFFSIIFAKDRKGKGSFCKLSAYDIIDGENYYLGSADNSGYLWVKLKTFSEMEIFIIFYF